MDKIIEEITLLYEHIKNNRFKIAELKKEKAEQRNRYWGEATGIAKEKEDYIKAMTSNIDENIRKYEAGIEYAYNMIEVYNMRLMLDE